MTRAGGSGSFFKNCKSEKIGEYVRGRQEGSRRREGEKNRDRRHGIKDVLFLKSFFFQPAREARGPEGPAR